MTEDAQDATFIKLRGLLEPYLAQARVKTDEPGSIYLEVEGTAKPEMFSAVMVKKSYVSFHYMPVYADPSLVESLPPELRKRMQGKSCFNFKQPDDAAIGDLERLVASTAPAFLARR